MSFLTEYFDEYRELPLRKTQICNPGNEFNFKERRKWYDPKTGTVTKTMSDSEIREFINKSMFELRGQSTYFNDHCSFLDQDFKTRQFVPKPKPKRPCNEEEAKKLEEQSAEIVLQPPLALKDTELMMQAKALYERDPAALTLEPLQTHFRTIGYIRPSYFATGLSEYADTICKLAYENILHDRLPRFVANNGNKPKWGIPPEGVRQPELDIVPFEGERIF